MIFLKKKNTKMNNLGEFKKLLLRQLKLKDEAILINLNIHVKVLSVMKEKEMN